MNRQQKQRMDSVVRVRSFLEANPVTGTLSYTSAREMMPTAGFETHERCWTMTATSAACSAVLFFNRSRGHHPPIEKERQRMPANRRKFLGRLTASAGMLGLMPFAVEGAGVDSGASELSSGFRSDWDLSWATKLTTKYRAVFDVPEIESGYGVWRATIWATQYQQTLAVEPKDMTAVLVLRHNGIVLAMNQTFWDRYQIGKERAVMHPVTAEPTDRNPALLSSGRGEQPAAFDPMALDKFIARGGIALACDLAFGDVVSLIATQDKVSEDIARAQAKSMFVPGVIMQPSGVFASIYAQDLGCRYLRAS